MYSVLFRTCVVTFVFVSFFASYSANSRLKNSINFSTKRDKSQFPPFKGCADVLYPPHSKVIIPTYNVNLDWTPERRWMEIVADKKEQVLALMESIRNNTDALFGDTVFFIIDHYMPLLTKTLPKEYYRELMGVANTSGLSIGEVTLFNVFYEFFSVCTSIVVQDTKGHMYHGRNLDFGLFLGWDSHNNTWLTAEYLRNLVINVNFIKDNKVLFSSVQFAGYIGVLTAVKKNAFSLTVNERFVLNGGYIGLAEWILGRHDQKWMGLLTRQVMETAESYKAAQKYLSSVPLIAPVYFILAGKKSHQGCVITRSRDDFDIWGLGAKHTNQTGDWYLVQTNYDHWNTPPFYDDRRNPAIVCMEKFGRQNPFDTMYKVLSTRPVLNKLTTYTALIEISTAKLETWIQNCEDPCWPW